MKNKYTLRNKISLLPQYLLLFLYLAFIAMSICYLIAASFSTNREIFMGEVFKFKTGFHLENYISAWKTNKLSVFFKNSLIYAIIGTVGALVIAAPAAYVLERYKFPFFNSLTRGLVIGMSVPLIMIIIPIYQLSIKWDIHGRLLLIILYICVNVPYTTIYLMTFFGTLSKEYEEAAMLDGCTTSQAFWKIMFPLVQPALMTVSIFNFMNTWNDYFLSMIFTHEDEYMALGVGLHRIVETMRQTSNYGGLFAAVVIIFVPTLIIYIFLSNRIINGVTAGGIKG